MRVLLVDNHPVVRLGIRTLLDAAGDGEGVIETGDAQEAVTITQNLRPDVVILDSELGAGKSGLEACRELKSLPDPPKVLVYTAQNSREDVAAAALAGADAYLHKGMECERLLDTINDTSNGERTWLLGAEDHIHTRLKANIDDSDLTPKEVEILALLLEHRDNREIADALCLSLNTIKTHVRNILKKLGVKSRKELFEDDSH